jgi:hypothetical protein
MSASLSSLANHSDPASHPTAKVLASQSNDIALMNASLQQGDPFLKVISALLKFCGFSRSEKLFFLGALKENCPVNALRLSLGDGAAPCSVGDSGRKVISKTLKKVICKLNISAVRKYQVELLICERKNAVSTVDGIINYLHVFHPNAYLCGKIFDFRRPASVHPGCGPPWVEPPRFGATLCRSRRPIPKIIQPTGGMCLSMAARSAAL